MSVLWLERKILDSQLWTKTGESERASKRDRERGRENLRKQCSHLIWHVFLFLIEEIMRLGKKGFWPYGEHSGCYIPPYTLINKQPMEFSSESCIIWNPFFREYEKKLFILLNHSSSTHTHTHLKRKNKNTKCESGLTAVKHFNRQKPSLVCKKLCVFSHRDKSKASEPSTWSRC